MLATITILIMLLFPFITKKIPASLVALIAGTVLGIYLIPSELVGEIPKGLPQFSFPVFKSDQFQDVIKSGFILAMLGCIESLLASLIVDDMTKTKHNSNRELIGQGIGNTVATLFGSLIGTGAIVRSVVNVNAGGRTRLSGTLHGLTLLIITLKFASLASNIPKAVLGGILMGTAIKMVEYNATKRLASASKKAGLIVIATTILTVVTDLTIAVAVGTFLSTLSFVIKMGNVYLKKYDVDTTDCNKKIASFTIEGPLFFGVAHAVVSKLEMESEDADIIVLNLMNMPVIDSSGAMLLKNIKDQIEQSGKTLVLAGVKANMTFMLKKLEVITDNELNVSTKRVGEVLDHVRYTMA
jgi:SulP family sulfate permease